MVKSWLVRLEVGGWVEELVVEEEVLVVLMMDEPESEPVPEPETETPELEPPEVVLETLAGRTRRSGILDTCIGRCCVRCRRGSALCARGIRGAGV
jgi:hypothetical protein